MLLFRPRSKTRYILSVERTHCTMTIARSCIVLRLLHSRLHPPKEYGERHSSDAIGAESPFKGSNCGWSLLLAQLAKEYPSRRTLRDRASQWTTHLFLLSRFHLGNRQWLLYGLTAEFYSGYSTTPYHHPLHYFPILCLTGARALSADSENIVELYTSR